MNVIDRPDLIQTFARKDSVGSTSAAPAHQAAATEAQDPGKTTIKDTSGKVKDKKEDGEEEDEKKGAIFLAVSYTHLTLPTIYSV